MRAATRSFHTFTRLRAPSTVHKGTTAPIASPPNAPITGGAPAASNTSTANWPQETPVGTNEYPDGPLTTARSSTGYVHATPDATTTAQEYDTPGTAYPTAYPYSDTPRAVQPNDPRLAALSNSRQNPSSTSASPAHPLLTKKVPTNESGIGESAAVRFRSAPGEMGARGGGDGGLGLMDKAGMKKGEMGELEDINRPPIQEIAVEIGRKGLGGWKERK